MQLSCLAIVHSLSRFDICLPARLCRIFEPEVEEVWRLNPPTARPGRELIGIAENPRAVGITVDAEVHCATASVQLLEMMLSGSRNSALREDDAYRIDMALTPRIPTRLCLTRRWASHRYERAGRIFILPPGECAELTCSAGQGSALVYHLGAEAFDRWLGQSIVWSDRQLEASLDVASPSIATLLSLVEAEARHPSFGSAILMESYAVQIAVNVFRYFGGIEQQSGCNGLAAWRLRIIDERLNDFEQLPTLAELAALCRLSVRQLSRAFRASRGIAIGEYVSTRRLEVAKELLRRGESVKAVSYRVGFGSPASFCYAFKKATGSTPGEFWSQTSTRIQ